MTELKKEIPTIWTTEKSDALNTGTWRSAIPVYQRRPSPCFDTCPVEGEIPIWVQKVKEKQYEQAWSVLMENNPFPAITGRICHHPCEGACNRGEYDGAVAINAMEQFIGDLALENNWEISVPSTKQNKKVAVVGGGPAGLSCAYQLGRQGYQVTVIEAKSELGGILRYGIPEYRLAKQVVTKEIQRLHKLGIEIRVNTSIKSTEDFVTLEKEFDAIFLALGAHRAKRLPQFGEDNPRVLDCLDVLARVNQGERPELGKQVVVIGGGSSAMDVARTARRLGSQVSVVAVETRDIMPAQKDEVEEALEEGIVLYHGSMVNSVDSAAGETMSLSCVKVVLDQNVPPGVIKPIPVPGEEFNLKANTIIQAVGQETELYDLPDLVGVLGNVIKVDENFSTGRRAVFAGGDVSSQYRFVSTAIGAGKKAAQSIIRYLVEGAPSNNEEPMKASVKKEIVAFKEVNLFYFEKAEGVKKGTVPPGLRLHDFCEVTKGISELQALSEADRCFSCGKCIRCNNCFYFCPDQAIAKDPNRIEGYYILDQYCKGCGMCVAECPRGAVLLKEEIR